MQIVDIKTTSLMLGVSLQTLRRWDKNKKLLARRDKERGHRYYYNYDIEEFVVQNYKYLFKMAKKWSFSMEPSETLPIFYCEDAYVFKARLSKLEKILQKDINLVNNFSLITSSVGEIGNNSFDHNIGKWPGLPGIFFGHCLKERKIILADRGLGVFTTLKRVKPSLLNDEEAIKTAFNQVISGRAPENRGNGLKYVKKIIQATSMELSFQSGKGLALFKNKGDMLVSGTKKEMKGCFIILSY
jgi:hypothetical protein